MQNTLWPARKLMGSTESVACEKVQTTDALDCSANPRAAGVCDNDRSGPLRVLPLRVRSFLTDVRRVNSLAADISVTALTNAAIAGGYFVVGVLAARMLGPAGRGELAAIQTVPSAIGSLAMLGLSEATVYFSARDSENAGSYLASAMCVAALASLVSMSAAWMAMPIFLHAQSAGTVRYARYFLLIGPLYATAGMLFSPLRGLGEFRPWNGLRVCLPLLALAVLAIAWLTNRASPGFIAIGYLGTYALLGIAAAFVVAKYVRGPFLPEFKRIRPMVRYGLACFLTGVPQLLNLRLDQMLMAAFLPSRELGLYVVAVAWSGAALPLLTSIGATLVPAVASAKSPELARRHLVQGVRGTVVLAIVTCTVVAGAAPVAIPLLFGVTFRASILPNLILVPAAGLLGINASLQESIRGWGRPYMVLRAELAGLITTTVCLALLLRPAGIVGAAIASLLGYLTVSAFLLEGARRITNVSVGEMLVPSLTELRSGLMRLAAAVRMIYLANL
jgi:O-antigen/teichoic acid export membrane protein